jgi:hypothetical protein
MDLRAAEAGILAKGWFAPDSTWQGSKYSNSRNWDEDEEETGGGLSSRLN